MAVGGLYYQYLRLKRSPVMVFDTSKKLPFKAVYVVPSQDQM